MTTQGFLSSLEWRVQFCLLVCCTHPSLSTVNKEKNLTDQRASLRVDTRETTVWTFGITFTVSVSISAQDGIVALGKAHTRSAPSLSSLPKVALKTVPIFVWLNTDRSRPWRVDVGHFLSPLLFPSGDQCCDALACPC